MKIIYRFIGVLSMAILMVGCGYTTRSTLPAHFRTIYVDDFKNKIDYASESRRNIYFPLLEVDARDAIVDRYLFDGNLKIAKEDLADLVLTGELLSYRRGVLRYTDNDDVEEYRVYITVALQLWDTHEQDYVWSESAFVGEGTYFVSGPESSTEESAVDEAIADLARRIVERTVENW